MADDLWIRDVLGGLTTTFARTAVECIRSMFQTECEVREPWEVVHRLEGRFDYIFSLISSSEKFKSTMCVGISLESMSRFIGCDISLEEAKDAFCEFGNIYCGMIADNESFTKHFGILIQSLPEDAINQTYFPEAWAAHGRLYNGDRWMYVGYSIGENRYDQAGLLS
jgi:hypothetical protein